MTQNTTAHRQMNKQNDLVSTSRGVTRAAAGSRLLNRFFLAHRFFWFGSWWVPGACRRAPEVPKTSTDGLGEPPGGPRSPRGLGQKQKNTILFVRALSSGPVVREVWRWICLHLRPAGNSTKLRVEIKYLMLGNAASGPEIGLPGRISAGF